jgi:hypothetical protein
MLLGAALGARGVVVEVKPAWRFAGEHVRMSVTDSAFVVDARYDFEVRPGAESLVLFYPFPKDSSLGEPELLGSSLTVPSPERPLSIVRGEDGWRWELDPSLGRQVSARIMYRQRMSAHRATYVLTSTREWHMPLGRAVLEVCLPAGLQAAISPRLPDIAVAGSTCIHRGVFYGWMPEGDLVVKVMGAQGGRR